MTIVHIGFKYGVKNTGGAAIASTRLHRALLDAGIDSHYVCVHKVDDGPNVHELPMGWRRGIFLFMTKFMRCIWKFTPYRKSICLNLIPLLGLERLLKKLNPDVVHVQWINADVASFEQLGRLRNVVKPTCKIVFNLHDLYVVLPGGGGYPLCNAYIEGLTKMNSTVIERWMFNRKQRMIAKVNPFFVGPSEWVCEACQRSIIGRGHSTYLISNIIDPIYKFHPEMLVPNDKFVLLFGCYGGRDNMWKGWSELSTALKLISHDVASKMEVRVFGEAGEDDIINGIPIKVVGNLSDPQQLLETYHHADAFAFPSVQETQGMTKCEALCCGLPVIAFNRTACAESIEHKVTGWVSPDGDIADYSKGIMYWEKKMRQDGWGARELISQKAKKIFDASRVVQRYLQVIS